MIQYYYLFLVIYSCVYIAFITWCIYHWLVSPNVDITTEINFPHVSIVIPFRNELEHLPHLLRSLDTLRYPPEKLEIIFVDDHSFDGSPDIIPVRSNIKLLYNSDSAMGKKAAVKTGIKNASHQVILITDADCVLPENWVSAIIAARKESDYDFTTGPIHLTGNSAFTQMQMLENIGMMVITNAGYASSLFHLANGANLSVLKSDYMGLKKTDIHADRASGDDIFLAQSLAGKQRIGFVKSKKTIVHTPAEKKLSDFIRQRIRWSSKIDVYREWFMKIIPLLVADYYSFILLTLLLSPFLGIKPGLYLLVVKIFSDLLLFLTARHFFQISPTRIIYVLPASLFHLLYVPIVGIYSIFKKEYRWKDRKTI